VERSKPFAGFLRVLRNRNFALLWGGQAISQLGDAVFYIALVWLVVELTGSALAVGTMMILTQVPRLVLQAVGGVIVDRYDRRKIMLLADLLRAMVVFIFASLVLAQVVELWHVYILAVIFGLVGAFFLPAQTAVIPLLVGKDELITANSLNSMTLQANNIIGPALGGVLISLPGVGVGGVSLFNALSFATGALGIWLIRLPAQEREGAGGSFWGALIGGLHYLRSYPVILTLAGLAALLNFAAAPIMVLMPLFAKEVLEVGVRGFGFMEAGVGAGLLTGSLVIGAIGKVRRRGPYILGLCTVDGLLLALFATARSLQVAIGVLFAFGVINSMINVVLMALLQEMVADEFRGRVFSLLMLLSGGLQPISMGLAGGLADLFGLVPVILACGLGVALIAAGGFLLREMRRLD